MKIDIANEKRMLEGNINRMCVTNKRSELVGMRNWAIKRINDIYEYNEARISDNDCCLKCIYYDSGDSSVGINEGCEYLFNIIDDEEELSVEQLSMIEDSMHQPICKIKKRYGL